jgi:hypothetical protein
MKIAGQPAHVGIIDDPFGSMADADSETIRKSVWEWYTGDFYSRLSKDAPVLITHTRWNRDDLAGRLLCQMADKAGDQWTVLNLPAIKTDKPTHQNDPRKPGEALWPAHKSESDLETIRRQNPRVYAALYQQDPSAAGAEFDPDWFGPDAWFDEWPKTGVKVVSLDPSKGKGDKYGDYATFVKLQFSDGVLYCDAEMANDWNTSIMVAVGIELLATWKPSAFGCEAVAFQELLLNDMDRVARERNLLFPGFAINQQGVPKEVRIRRLTPYLSQGKVKFKGGSPGTRLLVDQLMDFPNGQHDDGPDALEMALRLMEGQLTGNYEAVSNIKDLR